jgi:hypothetical protein
MSKKKWKVSVLPKQGSSYISVTIDADSSSDATKIVKEQYPNAQNVSSPTEIK